MAQDSEQRKSSWKEYSHKLSSNHLKSLVTRQLQRHKVNSKRKKMDRVPEAFSWVTGQYRNTPSGGVNERESGRGRWIETDRKGGRTGKEPKERERGPGRTSSHRTFLSHLALFTLLHVPRLYLFLSQETAQSRHCCRCGSGEGWTLSSDNGGQ